MTIEKPSAAQQAVQKIFEDIYRRAELGPSGACPVELTCEFVRLCHAQSCGKCVPCRIGLGTLSDLFEKVLDGRGDSSDLDLIERTAKTIAETADCAIGYEAGRKVLETLSLYKSDFESHLKNGTCTEGLKKGIPCQEACPAHVDIPGYIALAGEGKFDEAIALIRKDNPFPSVCGYICEHPCEAKCRRNLVDDAVNICAIKRYISDNSEDSVLPSCKAVQTGKKVAVVGGGPAGLTTAYYLTLMGHSVTVYEQREKLGGMLRYGIPDYRLPQNVLDRDIKYITDAGVKVETGCSCDGDDVQKLKKQFDAVYVSIGAHSDRKLGIEGEDAVNVISAVELLRDTGSGIRKDMKGNRVCVVGGGNVAMDCTRTCLRLGADVKCIYRRRIDDMTALAEEIEDARTEGAEIVPLFAPDHIEKDSSGKVSAFWAQKQIISSIGSDGRPGVRNASEGPKRFECDYVIVAIGQAINSKPLESAGVENNRGKIVAKPTSFVVDNVFAGGDAVSGPATVIKAIAAGKTAAFNIDRFLGFNHEISTDIKVPEAPMMNTSPCGRVNLSLTEFDNLDGNFTICQEGMTGEECSQECSRCLRCDSFGLGALKGGRSNRW